MFLILAVIVLIYAYATENWNVVPLAVIFIAMDLLAETVNKRKYAHSMDVKNVNRDDIDNNDQIRGD